MNEELDNDSGISIDDEELLDLGYESTEEIEKSINEKIEKGSTIGISNIGKQGLEQSFHKYRDVLRLRLGNGPPAKLSQMNTKLKKGSRPLQLDREDTRPKE